MYEYKELKTQKWFKMRLTGSASRKQHLINDTVLKLLDSNLSVTQILGVSHLCVVDGSS